MVKPNSKNWWHPNLKKYPGPPTVEQIDQVVKDMGFDNYTRFELFYGIPVGTIKKVKNPNGKRNMPVYYWHLFLEPMEKPVSVVRTQPDAPPPPPPKKKKNFIPKKKPVIPKGRLADLI